MNFIIGNEVLVVGGQLTRWQRDVLFTFRYKCLLIQQIQIFSYSTCVKVNSLEVFSEIGKFILKMGQHKSN